MSDYIDRQAFLEHMKGTNRYFNVKFDIESFPAADVRPVVRGEWELVRRTADGGDFKCSVCGRIVITNSFIGIGNFPFCHCGADMRSDK